VFHREVLRLVDVGCTSCNRHLFPPDTMAEAQDAPQAIPASEEVQAANRQAVFAKPVLADARFNLPGGLKVKKRRQKR
jgi:hypothetical protein